MEQFVYVMYEWRWALIAAVAILFAIGLGKSFIIDVIGMFWSREKKRRVWCVGCGVSLIDGESHLPSCPADPDGNWPL